MVARHVDHVWCVPCGRLWLGGLAGMSRFFESFLASLMSTISKLPSILLAVLSLASALAVVKGETFGAETVEHLLFAIWAVLAAMLWNAWPNK